MNDEVWKVLGYMLLAAFLGTIGQLIRVVIGLKKENDEARAANQPLNARFSAQELLTSLAIAVAVGAIAGVLTGLQSTNHLPGTKELLAFVGAGYSGTDFIEGFMSKALPQQSTSTAQQPANTPKIN